MTGRRCALLLCALLLPACAQSDATRSVAGAWVRTPPPGAATAAAYFVLSNGSTATELVGARSPAFRSAAIHETRTSAGTTRMTQVTPLRLRAGERLVFRPGGLHVMLIGPQVPLDRGNRVTIELEFADGQRLVFDAAIRDEAP